MKHNEITILAWRNSLFRAKRLALAWNLSAGHNYAQIQTKIATIDYLFLAKTAKTLNPQIPIQAIVHPPPSRPSGFLDSINSLMTLILLANVQNVAFPNFQIFSN